jgi:23S rRNA (uracil1939-C5)-methyltransferase
MNTIEKHQKIILKIYDLGINGEGVSDLDGYKIFVDKALVGEEVEAKIIQKNSKFAKAILLRVIKPSPNRIEPFCKYFDKCGGCHLQHMPYEDQLLFKQKKVENAIFYIGKIKDVEIEKCTPCDHEFFYRNKIQLPIRKEDGVTQIGLFSRQSNNLVDIDECKIHCKLGDSIFSKVKKKIIESKIEPFNPRTNRGFLKHLLIKTAINSKQVLIILITSKKDVKNLEKLAKEIFAIDPSIKGVIQNVNQKNDNVILGKTFFSLVGDENIYETIDGIKFKISAASFFQVNIFTAKNLYKKALEIAELSGEETVLDAYCGVGTISLFASKKAKKVIGIESVEEAVLDAEKNAKENNLKNIDFICSDCKSYIKKIKNIDTAFINPPRKGCERAFLEILKNDLFPNKIIYISCDPATLARDLNYLTEKNDQNSYKIKRIIPFDMFCQTSHVETLVLLEKPF